MSTESDGYLSFGVGMLLGMGIGAVLGLLLTPKSGQQMRSDIRSMANELPSNVNQNLDNTKDRAMSLIDKTKYNFEKQVKQIDDAIRAGKMAAAKKREELEEEEMTGY
jgi:gas vesicle protein